MMHLPRVTHWAHGCRQVWEGLEPQMSAESLPLPLVSLLLVWTCFCVTGFFSFWISSAASGTSGRWSPERSGFAQGCREGLTTVTGECRVPSPADLRKVLPIRGKCNRFSSKLLVSCKSAKSSSSPFYEEEDFCTLLKMSINSWPSSLLSALGLCLVLLLLWSNAVTTGNVGCIP